MRGILRFLLGLVAMPTEIGTTTTRLHRISDIESFQITLEELNTIKREGKNVGQDFSFFMFWLPIAVTTTLTLVGVSTLSLKQYCIFLIFTIIGFCFSAYFGIRAWLQRGSFENFINQIITQRRFGPVGDDNKEVRRSDLSVGQINPAGPPSQPPQASPTKNNTGSLVAPTVSTEPLSQQK